MSFRKYLSGGVATATVATFATEEIDKPTSVATVASVAVATDSERVTDRYHDKLKSTWRSERKLLRNDPELRLIPVALIDDALRTAVDIWNGEIGDFRTAAELRAHLTPDDLADRELLTPGGLALYCWTLWANGK
jgi:hypothetical protein